MVKVGLIIWRGGLFMGVMLAFFLSYPAWRVFSRDAEHGQRRASWLSFWARVALRVMGVEIISTGVMPSRGLVVSNHLGYLDILVFSALKPCRFISKSEVRSWPVVGFLTSLAGTIYVDRQRTSRLPETLAILSESLKVELPVLLFAEGTSSEGREVRAFRTPLLAAATSLETRVATACILYQVPDQEPEKACKVVEEKICYWGEMTFFPHLVTFFGVPRTRATVVFGESVEVDQDRKVTGARLLAEVRRLHAKLPKVFYSEPQEIPQ